MRTKKLISLVLLAAIGTTAQAQIVSSQSNQVIVTQQVKEKKPKKPRTFRWNLRLGYSFDSMTGGDNLSGSSGYDVSIGISKPFDNKNLFWGIEVGAMTYGACMEDYEYGPTRCVGISANPRIGVKFPIGQTTAFNVYGGPYFSYRWGEEDLNLLYYNNLGVWESESKHQMLDIDDGINAGIDIGAELFVSRNIFFNIHVKKGFLSCGRSGIVNNLYGSGNYSEDTKDISSMKIVLGIGFQF